MRTVDCPMAGCRTILHLDELRDHFVTHHGMTLDEWQEQNRRRAREQRRATLVAERPHMDGWTLDTFRADDLTGRRALGAIRAWLDGDGASTPRVYVYGPPGSGKSGLAYGVAYEWTESDDVIFENVPTLLEEQRARFARGESKAIDHLLDARSDYGDLVVLDDLGAERPTPFALETVALIVERLHVNDVPLIVTTNYAPAVLAEQLGHADLVAGQRIVDRLLEDALVIHLDRPSLRTRKVA